MFRRGVALAFAGSFLVVVALLSQTYATSRLLGTMVDSDATILMAGSARFPRESVPVRVTEIDHADPTRSTGETVVWSRLTCVVRARQGVPDCVSDDDASGALIWAEVDHFATDRSTAEAANDPTLLPADALPHQGLVNRFPPGARKASHEFWDPFVGQAFEAHYVGAGHTSGLATLHYRVRVSGQPMSLSTDQTASYSSVTDLYVAPATGQIVDRTVDQSRTDAQGSSVAEIHYAATPAQVASDVAQARTDARRLHLVHVVVPLAGYVAGGVLLLVCVLLLVLGRRTPTRAAGEHRISKQSISV